GSGVGVHTAGHLADYGDRALPEGNQVVAAKIIDYSSVEELLYDLYTIYLRDSYKPFTYGKDWVLAKASSYVTLLALPWQWLQHKRTRRLIDVIPQYTSQVTPTTTFGLQPSLYWGRRGVWVVLDREFEQACGLFS